MPLTSTEKDGKTLEWAVQVLNQEGSGPYAYGQYAYTAWAEDMLKDENFPAGNDELLNWRMVVVEDASMMIAARGDAARFLKQMAARNPKAHSDLLAAAAIYEQIERLASRLWDLMGKFEPRQNCMADHNARQIIANTLLEARDLDSNALQYLQKGLETLRFG